MNPQLSYPEGLRRGARAAVRSSRIRTKVLTAAALATACFGLTQVAQADTLVVTRDFSNYTASSGGEWGIVSISGLNTPTMGSGVAFSGNAFQSFCLERNEAVSPGTYNFTLSNSAHNGGVGGATNGADPISAATAYLFGLWWQGNLVNFGGSGNSYNYTFGSGRVASATELQNAIWYLEGELTANQISSSSVGWAWAQAALSAVGSSTDIGNVRVLTLTDSAGNPAQDMLVLVPLPTAAMIGFGLLSVIGVVGTLRRRRNRTDLA